MTFVVSPTSVTLASTVISTAAGRVATRARLPASHAKVRPVIGPKTRAKNSASAKASPPFERGVAARLTSFVSTTAMGASMPKIAVCCFSLTSKDRVSVSSESRPLERGGDVPHGGEDLSVGLLDAERYAPARGRHERRRHLRRQRPRHKQRAQNDRESASRADYRGRRLSLRPERAFPRRPPSGRVPRASAPGGRGALPGSATAARRRVSVRQQDGGEARRRRG